MGQVLEVENRILSSLLIADIDALRALLGPDYEFATADCVESKSQHLAALESRSLRYTKVHPREQQIKCYGEISVVTSSIELAGERDGHAFSGTYCSVRIYYKQTTSWQAVAGYLSPA